MLRGAMVCAARLWGRVAGDGGEMTQRGSVDGAAAISAT